MRYSKFLLSVFVCSTLSCSPQEESKVSPVIKIPNEPPKYEYSSIKLPPGVKWEKRSDDSYRFYLQDIPISWAKRYQGDIRLGSVLTSSLLDKATLEDMSYPFKAPLFLVANSVFLELGNINLYAQEEVLKIYEKVKSIKWNTATYISQTKRVYKDLRQIHTMYLGTYPEIEKTLFGVSYKTTKGKDKLRSGVIFEIESNVAFVRLDSPQETDLLPSKRIVSGLHLGTRAILVIDGSQENVSEYHLALYQDKAIYLDLLSGEICRGAEALSKYYTARNGEDDIKIRSLTFSQQRDGLLQDGFVSFDIDIAK